MAWPTEAASQMTIEERNNLIRNWLAQRAALESVKEAEMTLRKRVTEVLFPTPKKGTQRVPIGEGFHIKLVHKLNMKLGDSDKLNAAGDAIPVNDQVEDVLVAIEKIGNEGQFIADRLVKTSYTLSESEYKNLDLSNPTHKQIKDLIDTILTVTPASPSLEFEEPKTKA